MEDNQWEPTIYKVCFEESFIPTIRRLIIIGHIDDIFSKITKKKFKNSFGAFIWNFYADSKTAFVFVVA